MLNIFIAVILDNFMKVQESEKQDVLLTDEDLAKYEKTWQKFCPLAEHWIHAKYLPKFLKELPEPLGFNGQKEGILQVLKIVKNCNIDETGGYVHFAHLLWGLAYGIHGANMLTTAPVESLGTLASQLQDKFVELRSPAKGSDLLNNITEPSDNSAAKIIAGMIILEWWRNHKARKDARKLPHLRSGLPRQSSSTFF